jgi:hypothetical protein
MVTPQPSDADDTLSVAVVCWRRSGPDYSELHTTCFTTRSSSKERGPLAERGIHDASDRHAVNCCFVERKFKLTL